MPGWEALLTNCLAEVMDQVSLFAAAGWPCDQVTVFVETALRGLTGGDPIPDPPGEEEEERLSDEPGAECAEGGGRCRGLRPRERVDG
jgi:hypothetical protein